MFSDGAAAAASFYSITQGRQRCGRRSAISSALRESKTFAQSTPTFADSSSRYSAISLQSAEVSVAKINLKSATYANRTKWAKCGGLETNGTRERISGLCGCVVVRRFSREARGYWRFQRDEIRRRLLNAVRLAEREELERQSIVSMLYARPWLIASCAVWTVWIVGQTHERRRSMARLVDQLTEAKIRTITKVGLHPDGRGLYLQIRDHGARSWIYRYSLNGRTRDMGLGSLAEVSLVKARSKATAARTLRDAGTDPIEHAAELRAAQRVPAIAESGPTFEQAAEEYMAEKLPLLRSEVHRHQWRQTLQAYAYPLIGHVPVSDVDTAHVLSVLEPIWYSKCETASRLRGRIERILARATVKGHRVGSNSATWRGHLQEALPKRSDVAPVEHHAAMEFKAVPTLMADLRSRDGVSAAALQFLILTAARTTEVTDARWNEVDWNERTWTVPKERAKTKSKHVVPLSKQALAILRQVRELADISVGFIFPGSTGEGLSQMALLALLQRRMKHDVTVHGFRSSFRDWAGDEADVPRELAEASLAHIVKNATERAYRRKTAVERRRKVMQDWADYVLPPSPSAVVDIRSTARGSSVAA